MTIEDFKKLKLPDSPGVYFFRDKKGGILYIGRATSIRDRVRSYFGKDTILNRGPVVERMVREAKKITFIKTDSVLEAVILEANLIKKYQPRANVDLKDDKSFNYIVITKEKFPRVLLSRGKDVTRHFPKESRLYMIGPFPEGGVLKSGIKILRKIFPFRDKCAPVDTFATREGVRRPCFNRQIGLCPGVCRGEISAREYGRIIRNIILFFEGKKSRILRNLNVEMKSLAEARDFEKAQDIKRTISAINHIQDISLIKQEPLPIAKERTHFRIEAYDIAHTSGDEMVGVMVVLEDGKPKRSDYRKFKIRTVLSSDDTGALKEVMSRRLKHAEWPLPNLMVVDGSTAQRNVALSILSQSGVKVPVASVVKDERHKQRGIEGDYSLQDAGAVLLSNAEAHRFAINYHKKLRRNKFLPR